jgi:hypothetical protein
MSRSSDIAQDNTRRLAGSKGPANFSGYIIPAPGAYLRTTRTNIGNRAGRCVTTSRRLDKTTHHRVTDNEKFPFYKYHNPNCFQSQPV